MRAAYRNVKKKIAFICELLAQASRIATQWMCDNASESSLCTLESSNITTFTWAAAKRSILSTLDVKTSSSSRKKGFSLFSRWKSDPRASHALLRGGACSKCSRWRSGNDCVQNVQKCTFSQCIFICKFWSCMDANILLVRMPFRGGGHELFYGLAKIGSWIHTILLEDSRPNANEKNVLQVCRKDHTEHRAVVLLLRNRRQVNR